MNEPPEIPPRQLVRAGFERLPAAIVRAGEQAAWRFIEFFTANIRNRNTRAAYGRAVGRFCRWCEDRGVAFKAVTSSLVAAYLESLQQDGLGIPSVKLQHLIMCNPLATVVQQIRHAVIDPGAPTAGQAIGGDLRLLIPFGLTVALLVIGFWWFNREAPRIAEEL